MKDEVVKKTSGMKATTIEELSANYEQLGITLRKQLEKMIIFRSKGPWASIAFKIQDKSGNEWQPPKVMLAFFKNMEGFFTRYSYFNIKSKQEAIKIISFLISSFGIDKAEI
jgi:hypothetical protein